MAERENVIDFTVPYYDLVGLTILMKKPKFDYSLVKFLSVLDENVWGCIIGAFFIFSVLITVFDKLSPFRYGCGIFTLGCKIYIVCIYFGDGLLLGSQNNPLACSLVYLSG